MRPIASRGLLPAALIVMAVLVGPAGASEQNPGNVIRYADDALSVHLTKAPMSEVLQQLALQTGAEIRGWPHDSGDVTVSFDDVPLADGLARLFGDQNFALVYGKGGRLVRVRLLGGAQGAAVTRPPAGSQPPAAQFEWLGPLIALVDRHPPVAIDGALAEALNARTATLRQLLDVSLRDEDAEVRDEAVHTGMAALEADPAFRAAVKSIDSAELMAFLQSSQSEQAEEIAMRVLKQSQAPDIRLKASAVVQRLRPGG